MVSTVANFVGTRCQQEKKNQPKRLAEVARAELGVQLSRSVLPTVQNFGQTTTTEVLVVERDFQYQLLCFETQALLFSRVFAQTLPLLSSGFCFTSSEAHTCTVVCVVKFHFYFDSIKLFSHFRGLVCTLRFTRLYLETFTPLLTSSRAAFFLLLLSMRSSRSVTHRILPLAQLLLPPCNQCVRDILPLWKPHYQDITNTVSSTTSTAGSTASACKGLSLKLGLLLLFPTRSNIIHGY